MHDIVITINLDTTSKGKGEKRNLDCFRIHLLSQLTKLWAMIEMSLLMVNTDSQLVKVQKKNCQECSPLNSTSLPHLPRKAQGTYRRGCGQTNSQRWARLL